MSDTVYFNEQEALGRVRGNAVLLKRLLSIFLQSAEFAALEEALAANDIARAGEVAHGIKGMTGNLSLTALFETSTTLMNEFRTGLRDENSVAAYRDALEQTRNAVNDFLSR